jgi:hypothetical protein
MRTPLALIFLLFTCIHCNSVYARQMLTDLNFQIAGSASILKNDVAGAREEAIKNALENAIIHTAGILSGKFDDEKFQTMKSVMISKAERYVKHYRVISESREHDTYTVNLNVVITSAPVRKALLQMGLLWEQGKKEGIAVALSLKGMKKYSDFADLKAFLQNRFQIVKSIYPCRLEWRQAYFDLVVVGSVRNLLVELANSGKYSMETNYNDKDIVEIYLQVKEEAR